MLSADEFGWEAGIRAESRREARAGLRTCRLAKRTSGSERVWLAVRDEFRNWFVRGA